MAENTLLEPPMPRAPLGQPFLPDQPYESIDNLMGALNAWGKDRGLGFVKKKSANKVNGLPTYVEVVCDRGRARESQATVRKTSTAKTGCQWSGVAKALAINQRRWTFEIKHAEHNH